MYRAPVTLLRQHGWRLGRLGVGLCGYPTRLASELGSAVRTAPPAAGAGASSAPVRPTRREEPALSHTHAPGHADPQPPPPPPPPGSSLLTPVRRTPYANVKVSAQTSHHPVNTADGVPDPYCVFQN